jgi:lysophospholipase L1-like esterase
LDRRAKAGERLNVVFFGASLTWGANATDPQLTSYRAVIARRLEERYPAAHWTFWDAAIGGTGSQLGVFRLQRDVLRRKPDLVFLDFTANDDIYSDNAETSASYESLVRRIVVEAKTPVVQVIFPFLWNVKLGNLKDMKRRDAHRAIAAAYGTAVGDAVALAIDRVKAGTTTIEEIWPVDGVHPGDKGYELFADAAWTAFCGAVDGKQACSAPPEMLYGDSYMTAQRFHLVSLERLPQGWQRGKPHVVSAYFDMLMSRWLDDELIASNRQTVAGDDGSPRSTPQEVARLKVAFRGRMVMLFGEATPTSGRYRAYVDGRLVEHKSPDGKETLTEYDAGQLARRLGGNTHHAQVIAEGLDPQIEHTLEIEPLFDPATEQELRLESVCVAGGPASVSPPQ